MRNDEPVRWSDICRSAEILGWKDANANPKTEAFRINAIIEKRIAEGKVERIKTGLYRLVR